MILLKVEKNWTQRIQCVKVQHQFAPTLMNQQQLQQQRQPLKPHHPQHRTMTHQKNAQKTLMLSHIQEIVISI